MIVNTTWGRCGALAATLMLSACAATSPDTDPLARNKQVARRVFDEILNQGRFELFVEIYSPGFVKHIDGRRRNLAEEVRDAKFTRGLSSDLVMTVDQMIAEGDNVAIRYTGRGMNTGSLIPGSPGTGKKFAVSGMTVYRLADGKIVEEWTFYNELEMLRQLGLAGPFKK